jgi:hypothetical protein
MAVHVLHHGWCFDGAASSALFAAFWTRHFGPAELRYIPKDHRPGDPYCPEDFAGADPAVGLDFRYSQHPAMTWYFDHHASAFQMPGDRSHFAADRNGQKFHDDTAASCAGFIVRTVREHFACDLSAHAELITWAERIDAANFPSPEMPVLLAEPALQLMTFVESNQDLALVGPFIDDLRTRPLAEHASADYVQQIVRPRRLQNQDDLALIGRRADVADGVLSYALLDQPVRAYNKFIPYYHHPSVRYVVALTRGPDRRIRLTAGYNPWLPRDARQHSMAALLEPLGGGGHPYVGGCSFDADQEERALAVQRGLVDVLRGVAPPSGSSTA